MNILELSEQEIIRRNNLQQLRDLGIDPYPAAEYPTNAFSTEIKESFVDLTVVGKDDEGNDIRETATSENSRNVCIAGRIMSKRIMGKAAFAELQDSKGRIQVYITRDALANGEDTAAHRQDRCRRQCLRLLRRPRTPLSSAICRPHCKRRR